MGRRAAALIMSLIVVLILSLLAGSFFYAVTNNSRLVNRHINSLYAFWAAEAGISEAIDHMPSSPNSGTINNADFNAVTSSLGSEYYQIDSTASSNNITRSLTAIVRTDPVDPNNFQHAIRTTSNLVIHGSVDINGPQEEFASLNFANLFEHTKDEVKSYATHLYTDPPVDITPVDAITWVDLSPGEEFRVSSSGWVGSGILVVAGDAQITGGIFSGIIYVIGKLRMSGNPVINGTILAESKTEIDTNLTGNVTINYDPAAIADALSYLQFIAPVVVSWKEN